MNLLSLGRELLTEHQPAQLRDWLAWDLAWLSLAAAARWGMALLSWHPIAAAQPDGIPFLTMTEKKGTCTDLHAAALCCVQASSCPLTRLMGMPRLHRRHW